MSFNPHEYLLPAATQFRLHPGSVAERVFRNLETRLPHRDSPRTGSPTAFFQAFTPQAPVAIVSCPLDPQWGASVDKHYNVERKEHIRKLNNAFWLCHRAFDSKSHMVYGDVYSIPDDIGPVDITTCCSILLHVRDPFLALQKALRLTRERVIVTDAAEILGLPTSISGLKARLPGRLAAPPAKFLPNWRRSAPRETWWQLSPELVQAFIGVLGFGRTKVTHHYQTYRRGRLKVKLRQFTVVGERTVRVGSPAKNRQE